MIRVLRPDYKKKNLIREFNSLNRNTFFENIQWDE